MRVSRGLPGAVLVLPSLLSLLAALPSRVAFGYQGSTPGASSASVSGGASASVEEGRRNASQESRRLLLVAEDTNAPIVLRVAAELGAQGFTVVRVLAEPEQLDAEGLGAMARGAEAVAAVRVMVGKNAVQLSIVDLVRRQVHRHRLPRDAGLAVMSIRIAEILRLRLVGLLELPLPDPIPEERDPPRHAGNAAAPKGFPPADPRLARESPALSLAIGPARPLGWPSTSWHGVLGLLWPLHPGHRLHGMALSPLHGPQLPAVEGGSATVEIWAAGGGWSFEPFASQELGIGTGISAGAWGVLMRATGSPAEDQLASAHTRFSVAPYARLHAAVAITTGLRLRADLYAASVWPRMRVMSEAAEIGRWGALFALGTLGAEVALP